MTIEQEKTIDLLIEKVKGDKHIIGVILCGSLAKKTSNENSDVDVFIVVDDIDFETRRREKNYFWGTNYTSTEFPVEIDGKIINKDFLKRIWKDGSECIKSTFSNIKLLYSCDDEIIKLLEGKNMENKDREENIRKFYALMKSNKYKANDDKENIIQVKYCIFYTVYFTCRLVLLTRQ
ncbi:MAG: nucleotidyltransferase domain-containing protein [Spirochaetaceae bacterium]|jgi:predicted nucleotidyltransferase|nr:nucleotidyltransferase domain-containing protein [Spirochaetaceae bacterium]